MSSVKTVRRSDIFGRRAMVIALAISLAGHLFWLSAVKIISAPASRTPVKFSKIAFLGPILAKVDMEVRATPAARTSLEIRYRDIVGEMLRNKAISAKTSDTKNENREVAGQADQRLPHIIDDIVSGEKIEPDFQVE